ncbi:MAG: universal stress protein [Pseudomonadales bacterium]
MGQGTILAAIDLTEHSVPVLDAAKRLADATGARLSSVFVVQPLRGILGEYDLVPVGAGQVDYEDNALVNAAERLERLSGEFGIVADDRYVRSGKPAEQISELAIELGASMVVMGHHSRQGLDRMLGSTVLATLRMIACDVVVVNDLPEE